MATRTITTKLKLEGESEYKASLKNINSELSTLNAEMKTLDSEYADNANSVAALTAKCEVFNSILEKQKAKLDLISNQLEKAKTKQSEFENNAVSLAGKLEQQQAAFDGLDTDIQASGQAWAKYATELQKAESDLKKLSSSAEDTSAKEEKLKAKIEQLKTAMKELNDKTDGAAQSAGEMVLELQDLEKETAQNDANIQKAANSVNYYQKQVYDAQTAINNTTNALKENENAMESASEASEDLSNSMNDGADRVEGMQAAIDALGAALGAQKIAEGIEAIVEALWSCVEASVEFESAITGVYKTVDGSEEQLQAISDGIKEMSTVMPATTTEIAAVAEAAGQLGVGTEDILDFTEVMINLGESTNLSSEQAASALAKFANIAGTSTDDFGRLGSVIVALGNNFATTESDIVQLATRMVSTGALIGLTEPQIMALAAAMSSVGIEAEAGGTAISKLLKLFETMVATGSDELTRFAAVAGMSADEFAAAWGEDAVGALMSFISGLGEVDEAGGSAVAVLENLGITEVRLSNAVLSMANNSDLVTQALSMANTAWEENVALTNEAELRYGTLESRMAMFENATNNVKIAIGDSLRPAISMAVEAGTDLMTWASDYLEQNDGLVIGITALISVVGVMTAGVTAYTAATKLAALATEVLGNAVTLASGPFGAIALAIGGLIGVISLYADEADKASVHTEDLTEAAQSAEDAAESAKEAFVTTVNSAEASVEVTGKYIDRLDELSKKTSLTEDEQAEWHSLLTKITYQIPELAQYIDMESDSLLVSTDVLRDNADAWLERQKAAAGEQLISDYMTQRSNLEFELAENTTRLSHAQSDLDASTEILNELYGQQNEMLQAATEEQQRIYEQTGNLVDINTLLGDGYTELQEKIAEAESEHAGYEATLAEVKDAVDADNEALAEQSEALDIAGETLEEVYGINLGFAESEEKVADAAIDAASAQEQYTAILEEAQEALEEIQEEYDKAYESAKNSLDGQAGVFDELSKASSTSKEQMLANMKAQEGYWAEYETNFNSLISRNIAGVESFALAFADGTEESAEYLAILSDMSNDEIENMIASAQRSEEFKEQIAGQMAELATDATARMQEVKDNTVSKLEELPPATYQIGVNTMEGFISGIESKYPSVIAAMMQVCNSAKATMKASMGIASPSKVFKEYGKNTIEGYIGGIEDKQTQLQEVMKRAGEIAGESFAEGQEEAADLCDKVMSAYEKLVSEHYESIADDLNDVQDRLDSITDDLDDWYEKIEDAADDLLHIGDLMTEVKIKWSDGTSTSWMELTDINSQIETLEQYQQTIAALRSAGLSESLYEEILGMSVDDAIQYGSLLLDLSEEEFEKYNDQWRKKAELANEIANELYGEKVEELQQKYADTLSETDEILQKTMRGYGEDTIRALIEGIKSQEAALQAEASRIAGIIKNITTAQINGSHAGGLAYVPYDGYVAELHKGERVLTAGEAQQYFEDSLPSTQELIPRVDNSAAMLSTLSAMGALSGASKGDLIVTFVVNGTEFYRATIDDFRSVEAENPIIVNDF